jgi:hypothetical protein
MSIRAALPRQIRRRRRPMAMPSAVVPPDPMETLAGPLDPILVQLRSSLLPHRRRLWMRRLVRRGWIAIATVLVAELILWTIADRKSVV